MATFVPRVTELENQPSTFRVLGVRVNAIQIPRAISVMEEWIREGVGTRFVAVTGMHGVMEAQDNPQFKEILSQAP